MPRRADDARPPLSEWQADVMRLTAFCASAVGDERAGWFQRITGGEPEIRVAKPKEKHLIEAGSFGSRKLMLAVQGDRVDWFYLPSLIDAVVTDPEQSSVPVALDLLRKLAHEWLHDAPPVVRLAFGTVVKYQVENRAAGYHQISRYLPFDVDPETSSDFSYSINRARSSTSDIPNLTINRLSRWGIGTTVVRLGIAGGPTMVTVEPPGHDGHEYLIIELDINTAVGRPGELPRDLLERLFEELANSGAEIIREGDVP